MAWLNSARVKPRATVNVGMSDAQRVEAQQRRAAEAAGWVGAYVTASQNLPPRRPGRENYRAQPLMEMQEHGGPAGQVVPTFFGDAKPRIQRERRPDGARGRPIAPLPVPGARAVGRAEPLTESAARFDVLQALAFGKPLQMRPGVRVQLTATRRVQTIPERGRVMTWGSVDDLAQAIACGAF